MSAKRLSKWVGLAAAASVLAIGSAASAESAQDFVTEAKVFYRVVACGDGEIPAGLDARAVESHCQRQLKDVQRFRTRYVAKATPFFAKHRPQGLPDKVVYPFGGGDLASALITYPDASEYTTISLEHAGDPRRLSQLNPAQLRQSLTRYRAAISGLMRNHDSASVKLKTLEKGPLPGQLSFFIQALVALDYELVSLRYFRIEPDGSLHYYSQAEIAAVESKRATRKATKWIDTDYSVAFSNSELRFRKRGAGAGAPVKVHRHIAANLSNERFPDSALRKHLEAKGQVAAMTKAASYLLWSQYFSGIRDYLLNNMVFMFSDSTGIPPRFARKAGFAQKTFGRYTGAFLKAPAVHDKAFQALWTAQPYRALSFRYGYWDPVKNRHLLITWRK
ncbi:MAG: hypothetical protein AAGC55_09165 [Myxococcota bacterium]